MLNIICADHQHLLGMDPRWPLPVFFSAPKKRLPQETVISTEAPHGIIVSSTAQKSASLPPPFANPHRALASVRVVPLAGIRRAAALKRKEARARLTSTSIFPLED
jgi:hypothetical protein